MFIISFVYVAYKMIYILAYIILQSYRNRPLDSNTRRPNISLTIMILVKHIEFLVHPKIFVLNASIIISRSAY